MRRSFVCDNGLVGYVVKKINYGQLISSRVTS